MAEILARAVLLAGALYAGAGALFAVYLVTLGLERIDQTAARAGWGFRVVILPGVIVLWPLLLRRVLAGGGAPPQERNAHDRRAAESPL